VKVVTLSSWLNLGHPAPPGSGSAAGQKHLAPPYYSQRAVFASLWALFHFAFVCILSLDHSGYVVSIRLLDCKDLSLKWPFLACRWVVKPYFLAHSIIPKLHVTTFKILDCDLYNHFYVNCLGKKRRQFQYQFLLNWTVTTHHWRAMCLLPYCFCCVWYGSQQWPAGCDMYEHLPPVSSQWCDDATEQRLLPTSKFCIGIRLHTASGTEWPGRCRVDSEWRLSAQVEGKYVAHLLRCNSVTHGYRHSCHFGSGSCIGTS